MANSTFPLLKLPYLGQKHVVSIMTTSERIRYSLLSKNVKELIKTLRLKAAYIQLTFDDNTVTVHSSYEDRLKEWLVPAENEHVERLLSISPDIVKSIDKEAKDINIVVKKPEFKTIRDWLDHISDALKCRKLKIIFDGHAYYKPPIEISDLLQGYNISSVSCTICDPPLTGDIMEAFPEVREWELEAHPFEGDQKERFLSRSLDFFQPLSRFHIGIENLLQMDCKVIHIARDNELTAQQTNRFLRHWISSGTNRNLESLSAPFKEYEGYQQDLFNGIQYSTVPEEQCRASNVPNLSEFFPDVFVVQFEIWRQRDGRKATIQLEQIYDFIHFRMYVAQ
ncbi:hypothetical protein GCK72_011566 [Caenorhabditis remanei]|uniref:F-box domain-containing protein n=1 Tax=Caenorhabditis remanei TaxID=31234 RepID=A0A6A5H647_CAERE|nr:hypothetical protein GCK72_011566 [Caenorhabditis remanei]KAF1763300.1 hypothetical protein GCK72_011566 [Caenorhabditis remanei]